jgi:hypothetical protein
LRLLRRAGGIKTALAQLPELSEIAIPEVHAEGRGRDKVLQDGPRFSEGIPIGAQRLAGIDGGIPLAPILRRSDGEMSRW